MLEQLTYAQIGARLNISPDGARAIVKRNRLPRSHANDGRTLVAIDLAELQHKPMPATSQCGQAVTDVVATLRARIEQLEAELAAERQRYEHERERADMLVRSQEILDIQLKNLRLSLQTERTPTQAVAPWTLRELWRWLRTTRPATRPASEQLRLR
jgi:hypothetical protein